MNTENPFSIEKIEIIRSSNRRSIGISVYPDCSVKVRAPKRIAQYRIDEIVKSRIGWINKKIEYFVQNPPKRTQEKQYLDGESFYILGKEYKLRVIEAAKNKVEITDLEIIVFKNGRSQVKNILTKWLLNKAKDVFDAGLKAQFAIFVEHYKYNFPPLTIRKMKSRWGSMSSRGKMTLNSGLIHAPIECINYVIMHELCHLREQNHSYRFYKLQQQFTPNWKELKKELTTFSGEIKGL